MVGVQSTCGFESHLDDVVFQSTICLAHPEGNNRHMSCVPQEITVPWVIKTRASVKQAHSPSAGAEVLGNVCDLVS